MEYIMPLKAVILKQIELVISKALKWYNEKITDPNYLKCGYNDIAMELEFIITNLDLIEFKESSYNGCVDMLKKRLVKQ